MTIKLVQNDTLPVLNATINQRWLPCRFICGNS